MALKGAVPVKEELILDGEATSVGMYIIKEELPLVEIEACDVQFEVKEELDYASESSELHTDHVKVKLERKTCILADDAEANEKAEFLSGPADLYTQHEGKVEPSTLAGHMEMTEPKMEECSDLNTGSEHEAATELVNQASAVASGIDLEAHKWSRETGIHGVSAAAEQAGLYADHMVKGELVVGPEEVQRPKEASVRPGPSQSNGEIHYQCFHCSYTSASRVYLIRHIKRHSADKSYKCETCEYSSAYKAHLQLHVMRIHTGVKPYKCGYCNYASAQKTDLSVHQRVHTGEKPYSCDYCSYVAARKRDLCSHVRTHSGDKPYKCNICKYASIRKRDLLVHERTHSGTKPYKCGYCSFTSASQGHLLSHQKKHVGATFECDYCGNAYTIKSDLARHVKKHSKAKNTGIMKKVNRIIKCSECGYMCHGRQALIFHKRIHANNRHKCQYCPFTSKYKYNVKVHERTHTGEKPYKCDICNYVTAYRSHLLTHERVHNGVKPYKCGLCSYASVHKRDLIAHESLHSSDEPYKCGHCDYACMNPGNLKVHEKTHAPDKPYKCGECDYASAYEGHLLRHGRMRHSRGARKIEDCLK